MYRARDASGVVFVERLRSAHTHWTRLQGLLGTRGLEPGRGSWTNPCELARMMGLCYAPAIAFLDESFRVVRAIEELRPGEKSPKVAGATTVLELAAGTAMRVGSDPESKGFTIRSVRGGPEPRASDFTR